MKNFHALILTVMVLAPYASQAQWVQTNGPYGGVINTFAVKDSNVFAGTGNGGAFLSTDGGATWRAVNSGMGNSADVTSLAVSDSFIFAGINGGTVGSLYRSSDDGSNWSRADSGLPIPTNVFSLVRDGMNLFAGTYSDGVFRSTNNGWSWTAADSGITSSVPIFSLLVHGTSVFAGTSVGAFRSTNDGLSWTAIDSGLTNTFVTSLAAGPEGAGDTNLFAGTGYGIFRSTDNGTSWTETDSALHVAAHAITFRGTDLLVGTYGEGIFLSTDNGASWSALNSGLTFTLVQALIVGPNGAGDTDLLAGTAGRGVFLSTDNGTTWTESDSGITAHLVRACVSKDEIVFSGTDGGVYRTTNRGESWGQASTGLGNASVNAFVVSGTNLFAGTNYGPYLSTNNGTSWVHVGTGDVEFATITCFAVDGGKLYAGTFGKGVFLSTDDGSSWSGVSSGLTDSIVYALIIDDTSLFCGTHTGGVFRSTDDGSSWTAVNSGLTTTDVHAFAVSGAYLFAGTWGGGVFLSTNSGTGWAEANTGFGSCCVSAFAVQDSFIFAATGGNAVFGSSNNGSVWTAIDNGLEGGSVYALAIDSVTTVNAPDVDDATVDRRLFAAATDGDGLTQGIWVVPASKWAFAHPRPVSVAGKWNIVSLPARVEDSLTSKLFPTAISQAFAFLGNYIPRDTLTVGIGYWLKFDSSQTLVITGDSIGADSISVVEGWNLVGSISTPVPVSQITSNPAGITTSQFFGYKSTYTVADTIQPGGGYWVKVEQNGKLILSASGDISDANLIRIAPTSELPPSPPNADAGYPSGNLPQKFALDQNYPNPFNPATTISFSVPSPQFVTLKVFDLFGRQLSTLVSERKIAGTYEVRFNAGNLSNGVYWYRLQAGPFVKVLKMIILK